MFLVSILIVVMAGFITYLGFFYLFAFDANSITAAIIGKKHNFKIRFWIHVRVFIIGLICYLIGLMSGFILNLFNFLNLCPALMIISLFISLLIPVIYGVYLRLKDKNIEEK